MPGSSLGRHLESGVDPGNEVAEELKIFLVPRPFVVRVFHSVSERVRVGILESSPLSANFLAISQLTVNFNKSLLIFFPQFYILAFSIQNNFKRIHQLVSDVQRRLQQHDCF